jgi:3-keto-disaccharide hydrolase
MPLKQASQSRSSTAKRSPAGTATRTKPGALRTAPLVGGSLGANAPRNEFLATKRSYTNFVLRLKFKLLGTEGFVNGGVQVRSERATNPPNEMVGYQCDISEGWWGVLFDETRRNKVLIKPDDEAVKKTIKKGDWNEYVIRCEGKRIRSSINNVPMVDYTEPDDAIPQQGKLGLQIHGGGKTEIWYKDITIEEL